MKNQEASQLYQLNKSNREDDVILERNTGVKDWQHPAETITILKDSNESTSSTQIYTDGSKTEHGVGAGIAIFRFGKHLKNLKYRLNKKYTNNQAKQVAVLRAMEYIEKNRIGRQNDHNIYRQPSYIGRSQQKHQPLMFH